MRSFLYIPGNRRKMLDKTASLPADAFILDLEDSVPAAEKAEARVLVREYSGKIGDGRAWIRVNSLESGFFADDLAATLGAAGLAGYFVPKIDTVAQVAEIDRRLGDLERERGIATSTTKIILTAESARAVLFCHAIVTASPRILSIVFGGARDADLMNDLACSWSSDGPELMHARQHMLLGARAAGIEYPLDGAFTDIRDRDGFARDTVLSRRIGYRGRMLIHPDQIEPASRLYGRSAAEIDYYTRVVAAFEAAVARGQASTTVDGRMIDEAMAIAARKVLAEIRHVGP
ncbi:MAG: CoA ester lyase [Betaproteobacteria bacterium]|nr:CoA ester lyase [Betaproteobacteria bacterium]